MSSPLSRLAAAVLVLTCGPAAWAAEPSPSPAQDWPPGLPLAEMAGWEAVRGTYTVDAGRVEYELFVDPARVGLYRITRYRLTPPPGADGEGSLPMDTVQFIARPGEAPPLCYQRRVASGAARPWAVLAPGTTPYTQEMWRGIEVFQRQRQAHLEMLGEQ